MNIIERLDHYATQIPQEAPRLLDSDPSAEEWPTQGSIKLEDLVVAYDQSRDADIIKGISLDIKGGEKIGICGRTGCGKSTFVSSLFRMMEAKSGSIKVDGIDIKTVGLHTLRKRLQIIPQEPVLFNDTIRFNLSGGRDEVEDHQIWDALEQTGLKEFVSSLELKLETRITDGKSICT